MVVPARFLDISMPLHPGIPRWPGSKGVRVTRTQSIDAGHGVTVSRLECDVHAGTHVDAPAHFLKGGRTIDAIALEALIGPAEVLHLAEANIVTPRELEDSVLPRGVERVLLRTRNSDRRASATREFQEDYVALSTEAARWMVDRGVRLVGIDYLSVQPFREHEGVHAILMQHDIVILEGLDLSQVIPGKYELICLPLRLVGAEGAPARVVLRSLDEEAQNQLQTEKSGEKWDP
jgi:arylformamidase